MKWLLLKIKKGIEILGCKLQMWLNRPHLLFIQPHLLPNLGNVYFIFCIKNANGAWVCLLWHHVEHVTYKKAIFATLLIKWAPNIYRKLYKYNIFYADGLYTVLPDWLKLTDNMLISAIVIPPFYQMPIEEFIKLSVAQINGEQCFDEAKLQNFTNSASTELTPDIPDDVSLN